MRSAQAFGDNGYVWSWAQATFENWQSEFLQVFVFIVLTTFLVHRHSHESPDTDYENEAALRRIEAKLDALEQKVGSDERAGRHRRSGPGRAPPRGRQRAHWLFLVAVLRGRLASDARVDRAAGQRRLAAAAPRAGPGRHVRRLPRPWLDDLRDVLERGLEVLDPGLEQVASAPGGSTRTARSLHRRP